MNNKELKKLIKEKAQAIEIKDFSQDILNKFNQLPKETIEVKDKKFKWMLHPIFQMSAITFVGLFIMMLIISPSPTVYAFEEQDQVFASSAVSSLAYLSQTSGELSNQTSTLLSSHVESEIDDVMLFAELSERLLSPMSLTRNKNVLGYDYEITFETTDLLDESETYRLLFNESKQSKNRYQYIGIIEIGELSYDFEASVEFGQRYRFQFEIIDGNQMMVLNYVYRVDSYVYQVKHYKDQILTQTFEMKEFMINNQKHIMVGFKSEQAKGIYTFNVQEENSQKQLKARFVIRNAEDEEGEMIITPQSNALYQIEIRPNGGMPMIIERDRRPQPFGDNHPGHQGRN
jgi:hypothetical protein